MVEKTYYIAPYLGAFGAYLMPQGPIYGLKGVSITKTIVGLWFFWQVIHRLNTVMDPYNTYICFTSKDWITQTNTKAFSNKLTCVVDKRGCLERMHDGFTLPVIFQENMDRNTSSYFCPNQLSFVIFTSTWNL